MTAFKLTIRFALLFLAVVGSPFSAPSHSAFGSSEFLSFSNTLSQRETQQARQAFDLITQALPQGFLPDLSRLQRISFSKGANNGQAHGYFHANQNQITVDVEHLSKKKLLETIAHEIGHAYVFSKLEPVTLAAIAKDWGDWHTDPAPGSFYSHTLLRRFSGGNKLGDAFPSAYSYRNIHEWFSENFAQFVLHRLGYRSKLGIKMETHFSQLIENNTLKKPTAIQTTSIKHGSRTKRAGSFL